MLLFVLDNNPHNWQVFCRQTDSLLEIGSNTDEWTIIWVTSLLACTCDCVCDCTFWSLVGHCHWMKVCFKQCVVAFGVLCINAPFMHGVIVELRRCVRLAQFSGDFTITSAIVITYFSTPCRTWTLLLFITVIIIFVMAETPTVFQSKWITIVCISWRPSWNWRQPFWKCTAHHSPSILHFQNIWIPYSKIMWVWLGATSCPCHVGSPATRGHFCPEQVVAPGGRYYCICFWSTNNVESAWIMHEVAPIYDLVKWGWSGCSRHTVCDAGRRRCGTWAERVGSRHSHHESWTAS